MPDRLPHPGQWFEDWEPSRRPIQLPLPVLEYDSNFEVWAWKVKNLLSHNSLTLFIYHHRYPHKQIRPKEERSAATHCLSLLGSCISEHILADLLILSEDNQLPEDPCPLFQDVKELVTAVHNLWTVTNPELWGVFMGRERTFQTVKQIFGHMEKSRSAYDGLQCNIIPMAILLVKRHFPSCPVGPLQKYIARAKDGKTSIGDKLWVAMKSELMELI